MAISYRFKLWLGVFLFLVLISSIILFPHNPSHALLRKYVAIFITWPGMLLIVGLILLIRFRYEIGYFITHIRLLTPKGFEIGIRQDQQLPPPDGLRVTLQEATIAAMTVVEFERNIRYMFRSQFHLLCELQEKGSLNILESSKYYYKEFLVLGGGPNYSVESYLGWLEKFCKYIERNKDNFQLTELGKQFLYFIGIMKYSENEFKPL